MKNGIAGTGDGDPRPASVLHPRRGVRHDSPGVRLRSTPESRVPLRFYPDERVFKGVVRTSRPGNTGSVFQLSSMDSVMHCSAVAPYYRFN